MLLRRRNKILLAGDIRQRFLSDNTRPPAFIKETSRFHKLPGVLPKHQLCCHPICLHAFLSLDGNECHFLTLFQALKAIG